MGWKIIEKSVIPKDPTRGSEDAIFESDWCVAVLDGHSGRGNHALYEGRTLGQIAVSAGLEAFSRMAPTTSVRSIVETLSAAVRTALSGYPIKNPRPGFVFVAFLLERGIIFRVGDCQALVGTMPFQGELAVDTVIAGARSALLRSLLCNGESLDRLRAFDVSQDMVSTLIENWQPQFCNATHSVFGYGDVNGGVIHPLHIARCDVGQSDAQVVLASDGYPELRHTLAETEAHLRFVLERDPLCISVWPCVHGVRSGCDRSDDCAYVRLVRI